MSIVALKNAVVTLIQKSKGGAATSESRGSESTPLLGGSNNNNTRLDNSSSSSSDIIYGRNATQDLENSPSSIGKDNRNENDSSDNEKSNLGFFQSVDPRVISDLIIGLSDGLTVPFALTAGLSSLGDAKLVITGGFAELISGAISMGLGGYLGAKSESDYYHAEVKKEKRKFYDNSNLINREIEDILLEINPNFSDETIAVSYTHLDVYKRQSPNWHINSLMTLWKMEPLYDNGTSGLVLAIPASPSHNFKKFSAVLGTMSLYNSKTMRPCGLPPMEISKKAFGLVIFVLLSADLS